jgi:hypothetical protein
VPRPRRLKVFRTAIGFDDAYVAAPSRKAALEAWGAQKDLFAIGSAEVVTDPALTAEPLAYPGKVIRRSRGNLSEQLAAMPQRAQPAKPDASKPERPVRKSRPKPRPSRKALDDAEAAQQAFEDESRRELAALLEREERLRRERAALERKQADAAKALEQRVARARERYEQQLAAWRESV